MRYLPRTLRLEHLFGGLLLNLIITGVIGVSLLHQMPGCILEVLLLTLIPAFALTIALFRRIRRETARRERAEQALRRDQEDLEARIRERTAQIEQATVELANADRLLKTILENSPDRIFFKDLDSRFVHCSQSLGRWFNHSSVTALSGRTDADFYASQHATATRNDELKIIRTGEPIIAKIEREPHADGRITWARTSKLPWRDSDGKVIGIFGIASDITETKNAESNLAAAHQNLQASELRFRTLSAAAPIGIFQTDARGAALYFNPHWLTITGQTLEQSLGAGWQRAIHPADAEEMLKSRRTAERNGWGFSYEFRFRRPSGEIRWVHLRSVAVRSQTGGVTGFVGVAEDITDRRQAEELRRLQEAALRSAANIIVITNRAGNIVWTNPAFSRITGFTAEEVLGKNPRLLKNATAAATHYPAGYYETMWKKISNGEVWHGEFLNLRKDGSELAEEATITPVPNEKGQITHFVAVKQDITTRKHAEEELRKAQRELVELSRQAGMAEVATGVLHNVGNVLNSVNVAATCMAGRLRKSKTSSVQRVAQLLREHEKDLVRFFTEDARARQLPGFLTQLSEHLAVEQSQTLGELAELQKHIDHIKEIVVMQQNFAKVSQLTETLAVTHVIEDALRINTTALARHDIEIQRDFAATPVIKVDKHKLLQVLINLLNNAKQACDGVERDDKQITLRVLQANDRVQISVSDNGVGIPKENLTRIFNHGFTTKKTGHGFGLHSGALAAREMGGQLHVTSDGPGHGATFTLELPVTKN